MPSQADALRFVSDPHTAPEKLRRACEILALSGAGSTQVLRSKLVDYLILLDPLAPVVCLDPSADSAIAKE
jgi:hypothetical protein